MRRFAIVLLALSALTASATALVDESSLEPPSAKEVLATGIAAAEPIRGEVADEENQKERQKQASSEARQTQRDADQDREEREDAASRETAAAERQGLLVVAHVTNEASRLGAETPTLLEETLAELTRPAEKEIAALQEELETIIYQSTSEGEAETYNYANDGATGFQMSTPMIVATVTAVAAAAGVAAFWVASTSAGSAGATAKVAGKELRRVLPYASPLFTRFERETVMGHPKREHLYAAIVTEPGVSLQKLCDETGLSRTAVTHHLRLLEHHHLVVSKRLGRSRHYYENGGRYGHDQKEAYAVLQNDRSREVAQFIQTHPGAIQKNMCSALGLQASIAHWHVRRLVEASLVEAVKQGRTVAYFPTHELQTVQNS